MPRGIPNNPKSKKGPKPGTKYNKRPADGQAVELKKEPGRSLGATLDVAEKFNILRSNIATLTGASVGASPSFPNIGTLVQEEILHSVQALTELRHKVFGPVDSEISKPKAKIDPVAAAAEDEEDEDEGAAPPYIPQPPPLAPPVLPQSS